MFIFMQFLCCALFAQRFVNTSLDGAQTVCAITQDAQGMMWLGTDNGLYSYDGYHSYRHYAEQSCSNTRVNALATDGKHLLYLATGNGMLAFNMYTNAYEHTDAVDVFAGKGKHRGVKEARIINPDDKLHEYGSDVYALLKTPKGTLMGTLSGLYLLKNTNPHANSASGRRNLIDLCPGTQPLVNALAYDAKRHCYWIGTEGALYCADLQLQTFSKIGALDGNSIKCLTLDASGNLYIGTDDGLYQMEMNAAITHYSHDSSNASSIPNNIVWACYVDKWQNVWIGTDNGLSRLSTSCYYQFVSLDKITFSGEGNCLHALLQTSNGDWWMGGTNGLVHFQTSGALASAATYTNVVWYKQNNAAYPLSHNRVRKIYEDREGNVWICTDHGINLYDRQTRQLRNFIVYDKTGKYSTAWAYDILQDRQGRMWMASYMGGIFVVDKQMLLAAIAKQASSATATCVASRHFSDQGKNALSGLHVGQLVLDGKGMVWASTYNHLDRIDPVNMQVSHVGNTEPISYMMTDAKGRVWVGVNDKVKCFSADGTKEWTVGGKVSTMCDVNGSVWVVTGKVCCVLNPDGKSLRFAIPEITPFAIYYAHHSHRVVMGGNDGFLSIDEDIARPRVKPMTLMLAGVIVNGKQVQDLGANQPSLLDVAPRSLDKLTLRSDENNFTLQLTDLPFANHPSNVYAYQLEGSDHDWQYLENGKIDITYNGLSYGDYHLTVHVMDGEGNIGDEVYSLDISILPPWYLTIWAKLFYLTVLIVLVAWLVSYYFLRKQLVEEQRQKKEVLEQVEARMNFFHRLAENLKAAVAHQSFDEITELINHSIDVNTSIDELPTISAPANAAAEPETAKQLMEAAADGEQAPQPTAGDEAEKKEKKPEMDEADLRLLQEINKTIEERMIDSDFNVTMLQEVLGMGGKQLYRKMKALTGHTPVEYIREMRMRKASKLLKAGKFSVSEVMYTVGFSNSSYFSKCFNKAFGMTPTEYMRMS